jgi:segregation and condensation protein B
MSLKAKLEAVIYASEEPVTLAQLTSLFAGEALEWKAERDKVAAAAAAGALAPSAADPTALPLLSEAFSYLELEQGPAVEGVEVGGFAAEAGATGTGRNEPEAVTDEAAGAASELTGGPGSGSGNVAASESADGSGNGEATGEAEAESKSEADEAEAAKQEKKQREREARAAIKEVLGELIQDYASDERGIEIREIAGGFRMATKPEFHDAVRSFVKSLKPPLKLSLPALETLAVIAYKQPVTAPEVNEIRGVDSSGVFGSLLARKLIVTAGRKPVVGRPILYKTTREFLLRFGLKDVSELPSMEEFEKMAASELEVDEAPEEAAASEAEEFNPDPSVELEEAEAAEEAEPGPEPSGFANNGTAPPNSAE